MNASWKNLLQEYCQKHKISLPFYRIKKQSGPDHSLKFQVEVEVNGVRYVGDEYCPSKKEADQSAAKIACKCLLNRDSCSTSDETSLEVSIRVNSDENLNGSSVDSQLESLPSVQATATDSLQHFPDQYADIEQFIVDKIQQFNGRIYKIWPPNTRGQYKVEIGGSYHYCENVRRHHRKNKIYFIVNPVKRVYFQKCHDPECYGFQSTFKHIKKSRTTPLNPEVIDSMNNCSYCQVPLTDKISIECERCGKTFCVACIRDCDLCHDEIHCERCFELCFDSHHL